MQRQPRGGKAAAGGVWRWIPSCTCCPPAGPGASACAGPPLPVLTPAPSSGAGCIPGRFRDSRIVLVESRVGREVGERQAQLRVERRSLRGLQAVGALPIFGILNRRNAHEHAGPCWRARWHLRRAQRAMMKIGAGVTRALSPFRSGPFLAQLTSQSARPHQATCRSDAPLHGSLVSSPFLPPSLTTLHRPHPIFHHRLSTLQSSV